VNTIPVGINGPIPIPIINPGIFLGSFFTGDGDSFPASFYSKILLALITFISDFSVFFISSFFYSAFGGAFLTMKSSSSSSLNIFILLDAFFFCGPLTAKYALSFAWLILF
jgi:hypothetical protein